MIGEGFDKFRAHLPKRPEAMRLKKHEQPPRKLVQRAQRGRDLVRVMREIIDDDDACLLTDKFEAPGDASEI